MRKILRFAQLKGPDVSIVKLMAKIVGCILGAVLLALAIPLWVYFPGHNFRTVEEGVFYGSRQMGGGAIESAVKKYGVRTLINLRGHNPGSDWFDEEAAACQRLGIEHQSFGWSKNSLPDPESFNKFLDLVETGTKPFLAHCEGGTHRTGVAAASYLLLKGKSIAEARKQFGPFFNDAPIGQLVDLYEQSNGMTFRQWAREIYPQRYAEWKARKEQWEKEQKELQKAA